MKRWFISPTGELLEIERCLKEGLLSQSYPLPFLMLCAAEREWKGVVSTTQSINGTRLEYLKLTTDYAVDPDGMAYAVLGTRSHKKLEDFDTDFTFAEEKLTQEDISGILDLLEKQSNGDWWLVDYKTWGSYKVAKALGIIKQDKPLLDEAGKPVLLKTGKNKGKPKTEKVFGRDPKAVNMEDAIWQLNRYRMMAEEALQEPIKAMKVFAFVRDGGTYMTKSRGLDWNTYYLDVPFRADEIVRGYFVRKKDALLGAMEKKEMPPPCNAEECWEGRRCQDYCPVKEACQAVGDNPYLQKESAA